MTHCDAHSELLYAAIVVGPMRAKIVPTESYIILIYFVYVYICLLLASSPWIILGQDDELDFALQFFSDSNNSFHKL